MLTLLGDETRLRVLCALLEREHSVNELAELVGAQPAAVPPLMGTLSISAVTAWAATVEAERAIGLGV